MTHKPYRELEKYFERIVNTQPPKELTMFKQSVEKIKAKWNELWTTHYTWIEDANSVQQPVEESWSFEMVTAEWINAEGETVPVKHTCIVEPHEGTWMKVLDKVIDEMEKHYGYNIKEQVYYSVNFPLNDKDPYTGVPFAGHGRCLNDERLQQILLAFPELYESRPWSDNSEEEAMFK